MKRKIRSILSLSSTEPKLATDEPINSKVSEQVDIGRRNARALWFVAAIALAVAGCSSEDNASESTEVNAESSDDLAFSDGTATTQAEDADGGDKGPIVTSESGDDQSDDKTSVTAGSGMPPVTTIPGRNVGDPQNLYTGVIGNLGLNEVVVESDIAPPQVAAGILPLTGEPAGSGGVPNRPAAVVKIDNGAPASPHVGLNSADIVIEEEVEGGVTRFASIFHSQSTIVGPVRSGRSTDVSLISSLGTPLLMYSGANDVTEEILRNQTQIQNRNFETSSGYWRDSARRAPSNLFTDTDPHWASANGGPPPAQFAFRDPSTEVTAGFETKSFSIDYPSSSASWRWDGKQWLRNQRGKEHILESGEQVSAANVVVIEAERVGTGLVDGAGGVVPEFVFVGTGNATVFVDGRRISATWTRPTLASVATVTAADGSLVELTPGRTWIQLIESNSGFLNAES